MKIEMRRKGIGTCLIFWAVLWLFLIDANAQQEKPMMESGPRMPIMELGGPGRIEERGLVAMLRMWQTYFFLQKGPLKLTEDQIDRIESILNDQRKYIARKMADQKILLIDIEQLLLKEPYDLKKVQVKDLEDLNVEIIMAEAQTLRKALAVLTSEQQQRMLTFFKESRFTGPYGT